MSYEDKVRLLRMTCYRADGETDRSKVRSACEGSRPRVVGVCNSEHDDIERKMLT